MLAGLRGLRDDFDLEDRWPLLAGDEEAVVLGVVGYAVEDRFGGEALLGGEEAGAVDPGEDVAVGGGDFDDAVGVPDVRVDDAVDVFKFVELRDGGGAVVDEEAAGLCEGCGVAEAEVGGAVRSDEFARGAGDAPAFAGVVKLAEEFESFAVVDEAGVGLPGPLEEGVTIGDDAFAEVLGREIDVLGWGRDAEGINEQAGVRFEADAFVDEAVRVEEAFGVAVGGVGIGVEDLVGVGGGLGAGERGEEKKQGEAGEHASPVYGPGSTVAVR